MNRAFHYPDEPAGPFPSPPGQFEDREGRRIEIRAFDGEGAPGIADEEGTGRTVGADDRPTEREGTRDPFEALVEMYVEFDPADRAQGIPPSGEQRVREWLETIGEGAINVVAWHGDRIAGHATLVPDVADPDAVEDPAECAWELAIFVLQAYQRAGIGTVLLEYLLGHASDVGVERVWLTVERWNTPAIALYERVGFEVCGSESFEQEMAIRLA